MIGSQDILKPFNVAEAVTTAAMRAEEAVLPPTRVCNEIQMYKTMYASKITKLSARQYAYLAYKQQSFTPTRDMLLGNEMAEIALSGLRQELGGAVDLGSFKVAYHADGMYVDDDNYLWCFEHKYLFRGSPDLWKIQAAAAQLLFYTALTNRMRGMEATTGHYTKEKDSMEIPHDCPIKMCLVVTLPDRVLAWEHEPKQSEMDRSIDFYTKKCDGIMSAVNRYSNWDAVNEWDLKYKHKEHLEFFPNLTLENFKTLKHGT